jgi:hypothetical protein
MLIATSVGPNARLGVGDEVVHALAMAILAKLDLTHLDWVKDHASQ